MAFVTPIDQQGANSFLKETHPIVTIRRHTNIRPGRKQQNGESAGTYGASRNQHESADSSRK
jgi:hypothetical protein